MTYRSVSEALSVVSSVERTWDQMYGGFEPLLRKNPAVSSAKLRQLLTKLEARPASSFIQIGDDVLTGIVRNALGSSRANIVLAKEILIGPNASSNLSIVFSLVDSAKVVLRQLGNLATSVRTLEDWTSTGGSSSLVRINGLGIEPFTVFAIVVLVAGVVWFVVGVSILIDTMQRSQNAEIARENANLMCERAAARGRPCTPEDWQANYEAAAAAQQEISPTILGPHRGADPLQSISDLILWGGLIVIGAGVGYAILNRERERRLYQHSFSGTAPEIRSNLISAGSLRSGDWVRLEPGPDGWKQVNSVTRIGGFDVFVEFDDGTASEHDEMEIFLVRRPAH